MNPSSSSIWSFPIIHGSFRHRRFSILGKTLDMILLARRSRHFAGTRYLKRGLNVHGDVANDCEVEQVSFLNLISLFFPFLKYFFHLDYSNRMWR